jgi:hypothetical protein
MRHISSLLLLVVIVWPASAQYYSRSYCYPSYSYPSYSYPSYSYPTYYSYPSYSYPSYYYPTYSYPTYYSYSTPTYTAPTYTSQNVTYKTVDWRAKLLEIAGDRDRAEYQIVKGALEQRYFMDATAALGFNRPGVGHGYLAGYYGIGGYTPPTYGVSTSYPGAYGSAYTHSTLNLGQFGANASTIYGNTLQSLFQQPDLNILFQQAARLAQGAQTLSGQATTDFQSSISQMGNNQSKVAEILAKGQAAAAAFQGLQPSGQYSQSTKVDLDSRPKIPDWKGAPDISGGTGGPSSLNNPGGSGLPSLQELAGAWKQSAEQHCAGCHGTKVQEGKFNVWNVTKMDLSQRLVVLSRIHSHDEKMRMPKGKAPLGEQELKMWDLYLTQP